MSSVFSVHLTQDTSDMFLNCLFTNPYDISNFFVYVALGDIGQNLCFALGERGMVLVFTVASIVLYTFNLEIDTA